MHTTHRPPSLSHGERIRLPHPLPLLPAGAAFEWLEGAGLVEMEDEIELRRQVGVEVVAVPLGLGAIDHADRALESRLVESLLHTRDAQIEQEVRDADAVKERFRA